MFIGLFALAFIVRLACFTGLINSDDLGYAYFAELASRGDYAAIGSHLGLRVGLTFPTGLAYALFGRGEFSSVLVPLLASSACVPLVVALGLRLGSPRSALIAGLLMLSFPIPVRYASILVPETVAEFWLLAGALAYLHARDGGRAVVALGAGLLFGMAYLTKEIALFVAAAFVLDALLQRRWRLVAGLVAGLAIVGGGEMVAYALTTGDPLYRSHVVQQSQLIYFADQMESARSNWRLFKEYPYEMLIPGIEMGLHSLFTLLLCAVAVFQVSPPVRRLLLLWSVLPFLYLNFGSASMTTYLPVAAGPRYVAIVYAPLFLLAATLLDRAMRGPRARWVVSLLLGLVLCIDIGCAYLSRNTGYHADEVGSLRSIASREASRGERATVFTGPRAAAWAFSLHLLDSSAAAPAKCLSVSPDALGLPHAEAQLSCPTGPRDKLPEYPLK